MEETGYVIATAVLVLSFVVTIIIRIWMINRTYKKREREMIANYGEEFMKNILELNLQLVELCAELSKENRELKGEDK